MSIPTDPLLPTHTDTDAYGRLTIPTHVSDHIIWIKGTESLRAWLFLIELGRYRLLSDDQVQNDRHLEPIRALVLEGRSAILTEPTHAIALERAAMVARLVPITISPPKPGWRFTFPKAFDAFAPPECNRAAFSILLSLEGYLEIWYTDVLRRAGLLPWDGHQERVRR
jgi:hypothetical protein